MRAILAGIGPLREWSSSLPSSLVDSQKLRYLFKEVFPKMSASKILKHPDFLKYFGSPKVLQPKEDDDVVEHDHLPRRTLLDTAFENLKKEAPLKNEHLWNKHQKAKWEEFYAYLAEIKGKVPLSKYFISACDPPFDIFPVM
jgi:hypothetical protein